MQGRPPGRWAERVSSAWRSPQILAAPPLPVGDGLLRQCSLVDQALGELGQLLVGPALLVERLLQQRHVALAPRRAGVGRDGAVAGDLVVLPLLGRSISPASITSGSASLE